MTIEPEAGPKTRLPVQRSSTVLPRPIVSRMCARRPGALRNAYSSP
jgi:hypothetical protein